MSSHATPWPLVPKTERCHGWLLPLSQVPELRRSHPSSTQVSHVWFKKLWYLTGIHLSVCSLCIYIHIGIFGPMIPFAAANWVSFILVNRQDYPSSTPLSDVELAELGSLDLETGAKALAQQGLGMGLFRSWLIREENIPPMSINQDGTVVFTRKVKSKRCSYNALLFLEVTKARAFLTITFLKW
jgi:hypothetical protein